MLSLGLAIMWIHTSCWMCSIVFLICTLWFRNELAYLAAWTKIEAILQEQNKNTVLSRLQHAYAKSVFEVFRPCKTYLLPFFHGNITTRVDRVIVQLGCITCRVGLYCGFAESFLEQTNFAIHGWVGSHIILCCNCGADKGRKNDVLGVYNFNKKRESGYEGSSEIPESISVFSKIREFSWAVSSSNMSIFDEAGVAKCGNGPHWESYGAAEAIVRQRIKRSAKPTCLLQ